MINKRVSVNNIAKDIGLAYQTVYGYLQYMESEGIVEVSYKLKER